MDMLKKSIIFDELYSPGYLVSRFVYPTDLNTRQCMNLPSMTTPTAYPLILTNPITTLTNDDQVNNLPIVNVLGCDVDIFLGDSSSSNGYKLSDGKYRFIIPYVETRSSRYNHYLLLRFYSGIFNQGVPAGNSSTMVTNVIIPICSTYYPSNNSTYPNVGYADLLMDFTLTETSMRINARGFTQGTLGYYYQMPKLFTSTAL